MPCTTSMSSWPLVQRCCTKLSKNFYWYSTLWPGSLDSAMLSNQETTPRDTEATKRSLPVVSLPIFHQRKSNCRGICTKCLHQWKLQVIGHWTTKKATRTPDNALEGSDSSYEQTLHEEKENNCSDHRILRSNHTIHLRAIDMTLQAY